MTELSNTDITEFPDLIEPIIGYRWWRREGTTLYAPFTGERWGAEPMTARCAPPPIAPELRSFTPSVISDPHEAPHPDCSCGIYAHRSPDEVTSLAFARNHPGCVVGMIRAWGAIQIHEQGFRAEYAQLIACIIPARVPQDAPIRRWTYQYPSPLGIARLVAEAHHIPLYRADELPGLVT